MLIWEMFNDGYNVIRSSFHVRKTHYLDFTPRDRFIDDVFVKIHDVQKQRFYATEF